VTLSRRFSLTQHVVNFLAACAQSLYALRTLRHHGLNSRLIEAIFQATVVSKPTYASPGWWGYRSAYDPSLASHCDETENKLFADVTANTCHILYLLLPPPPPVTLVTIFGNMLMTTSFQSGAQLLRRINFLMRNLYKNMHVLQPEQYSIALPHCNITKLLTIEIIPQSFSATYIHSYTQSVLGLLCATAV